MAAGKSSFKVPYDLRPCKQIERRMMLHALQGLQEVGFPVSRYQYTGFGSIFFVDFVLIRKLLGIYDMQSIELNPELESRVRYNVPNSDINIEIGDVGNYIPHLAVDKQHFLWLDYDDVFQAYMVEHLVEASKILSPGSIIMVTVDVDYDSLDCPTNAVWFNHFKDEAGEFMPAGMDKDNFTPDDIPLAVSQIFAAIMSKISYRPNISFLPMFNFVYADGHEMQTLGGMICDAGARALINRYSWSQFNFLRREFAQEPYRIKMPVLTRKERLFLDTHLPADGAWEPTAFNLKKEQLDQYKAVYKYSPMYAELLL